MDSVVKSVLEYIQKQEGHQFSVLAGGAVRDEHFGLTPKDYDLFIPSTSPRQINELKDSMIKDLGIEDVILKGTQYEGLTEHSGQKVTGVYGFFYADKEFDLIGVKEEDDGDFGDIVINSFDYGINMLWHDGVTKYESPKFQDDVWGRRLTLHNIKTLDALPKAMERFNKFNEKLGGGYLFRCPKLTLKGDERDIKTLPRKKFPDLVFDDAENTEVGWGEDPIPTPNIAPTATIPTMGGVGTGWTGGLGTTGVWAANTGNTINVAEQATITQETIINQMNNLLNNN